MLDIHRRLIAYSDFRRAAIGYSFSGKALWAGIKAGCIRGAITWNQATGEIRDPQFPVLLIHWLTENPRSTKY